MYELIENFPSQLLDAERLAKGVKLIRNNADIHNVIISGLGGSGIGGHAIIELCASELKVPVVVNNSYELPSFANENSLIILSSYSGNTEEVLYVGQKVKSKGLTAICVTSGGKLEQFAKDNQWSYMPVPSGFPPRTCFGYSVLFLLHILEQHHLISNDFWQTNSKVSRLLTDNQEEIKISSKEIASKLNGRMFAIFADQWFHSLTVRAKQQFNENSKSLCWANVFPEMNHNELVAWRGNLEKLSILVFRSAQEHPRNKHRLEFSKEVIAATGCDVIEVNAKGDSHFAEYFYLTHFSDWISFYLAEMQEYDPMEIIVLNNLKAHLANLQ